MSNPLDNLIKVPGERVFNPQYERKPSGFIVVNGQEVAHTLQCCHCNKHFVSIRGSGKRRGFCTHCNKVTCGAKNCDVCLPFERKLELAEGSKVQVKEFSKVQMIQLIDPSGKVLI